MGRPRFLDRHPQLGLYTDKVESQVLRAMPKKKHHFVPKLHLRAFAADRELVERPKLIHLYNLKNNFALSEVKLADQCQKHRFYGPTDDLEDAFMRLENEVAPLLRTIASTERLPQPQSAEFYRLLSFVALQAIRTTAAAETAESIVDKLAKLMFHPLAREAGVDVTKARLRPSNPALLSLGSYGAILTVLGDLCAHLVCARGKQRFITSDNPVVRYNQYCEELQDTGSIGWARSGLLVFFPLSPSSVLILYDREVYKVGKPGSDHTAEVSDSDVQQLNLLQCVSAAENVYFDLWDFHRAVGDLAKSAAGQRRARQASVMTFEDENDSDHILHHVSEQMPNLRLKFSFLSVRRAARRVPLKSRAVIRTAHRRMNRVAIEGTADTIERYTRFVRRNGE